MGFDEKSWKYLEPFREFESKEKRTNTCGRRLGPGMGNNGKGNNPRGIKNKYFVIKISKLLMKSEIHF